MILKEYGETEKGYVYVEYRISHHKTKFVCQQDKEGFWTLYWIKPNGNLVTLETFGIYRQSDVEKAAWCCAKVVEG